MGTAKRVVNTEKEDLAAKRHVMLVVWKYFGNIKHNYVDQEQVLCRMCLAFFYISDLFVCFKVPPQITVMSVKPDLNAIQSKNASLYVIAIDTPYEKGSQTLL